MTGSGYDVVLEHSGLMDGLNVFAGYSEIDQTARVGDRTAKAIGGTYAWGSFTAGYQYSKDTNPGVDGSHSCILRKQCVRTYICCK